MPAVSKSQQKFMGMVHAAQKGEKPASAKVAKVAKKMKKKSAKDFASTKHKGLPYKMKQEILDKLREFVRQELEEKQNKIDELQVSKERMIEIESQLSEVQEHMKNLKA